jgi:hypothetical protein
VPGTFHLAVLYSPTFTMKLTGEEFVSGAVVKIGNTALQTTFVNSQELTATVPASLLQAVGDNLVTVTNPGGTVSNSRHFYVTAPD